MNVFKRELRANLKAMIIWSVSMFLLVLVGMTKYEGIAASGQASIQLFNSLPDSIKSIFGLSDVDITQASGFYSMFFLYFMLLAAVHSGMLGATIISKEERDKTADYLFSKPRTRLVIMGGKLGAWFVNIVVINIVTCLSSILMLGKYGTDKALNGRVVEMMTALFLLQVLFGAIGMLASSLSGTSKRGTGVTTVIILGTYMLSIAMSVNKDFEVVRALTPFKYFNSVEIMKGNGIDVAFAVLTCGLSLIFAILALYKYNKRDLKV